MSYANVVNFGTSVEKSPNNNPLTYCMTSDLNNSFMHTMGERVGPYSKKCQMFMSDYCAKNWNGVCEVASKNTNNHYPNTATPWECHKSNQGATLGNGLGNAFSQGELLIRNTAAKKYITRMSNNCKIRYEPFDPMVPTSPMISYWGSDREARGVCIPKYEVNAKEIDSDPVMNKILSKPVIAIDILLNIYNTMKNDGKLHELNGTRLGRFFNSQKFQDYAGITKVKADNGMSQIYRM